MSGGGGEIMKGRKRPVIALQTCRVYDSLTEAAASVKGARTDTICRCCYEERNHAGGYSWRFADEIMQRAAEQGKTLRAVCDEELARIAMRSIYGEGRRA